MTNTLARRQSALPPLLEQKLYEALAELRTGTITLLVQDGRVVQLDRHEKFRLTGMYNWHGDGI
ncbi:YezD family protein [Trichlorobacter lovleyi]|uniref:DUF2292 domain-containing protein n=1 Tax=Trichlorobacter lovleyi (strain ATCC BAA-1151 / DSM 17278 / SZ) TaxID=398767 RepID=B3E962_TRIL1|nr:YezD family protein [Trichlorobacter lovleyi]ACD96775.1 hypothetical protein Glov_3069 [Trichlorobacter lovleyi SZ]